MAAPKAEAPAAAAKSESAPPMPLPTAPAARSPLAAWLPVIVAVLLAPAATWATVEYVLLPRLQKKIATAGTEQASEAAATATAESGGHGAKVGKDGKAVKDGQPGSYEFQNIVVNLAGTMGTRYLKTTFLVTGVKDVDIKAMFEGAKPRLLDITNNVLSSLTLADLEEPGSRNVIREKLVASYNQALGKKVAEQVYFSDFVIQ